MQKASERIAFDPLVVVSRDSGTPPADLPADSPVAGAFAAIVGALPAPESSDFPQPVTQQKDIPRMKIAIPVAAGRLCAHFGHCEQFALVYGDPAGKTVTKTEYLTPPPHEPGLLPRWLGEQGAGVILAGGMGRRAQDLFAASGIEVVVGAPAGTPDELAAAYLQGTLEAGQNVCDH